jgi:hypothetical protein
MWTAGTSALAGICDHVRVLLWRPGPSGLLRCNNGLAAIGHL